MNSLVRSLSKASALAIFLILWSQELLACPLCHTENGVKVRDAIFNSSFLPTLGMTLLPFVFVVALAVTTYTGWPFEKVRRREALDHRLGAERL